jgi:hypothetical protein
MGNLETSGLETRTGDLGLPASISYGEIPCFMRKDAGLVLFACSSSSDGPLAFEIGERHV